MAIASLTGRIRLGTTNVDEYVCVQNKRKTIYIFEDTPKAYLGEIHMEPLLPTVLLSLTFYQKNCYDELINV